MLLTGEQYSAEVIQALSARFERPTSAKRWDTPLFIFEREDLARLRARGQQLSSDSETRIADTRAPPADSTPEPPAECSPRSEHYTATDRIRTESIDGVGDGDGTGAPLAHEAADEPEATEQEVSPDADAVFDAIYAALFGRRPARAHLATREKPLLAPAPATVTTVASVPPAAPTPQQQHTPSQSSAPAAMKPSTSTEPAPSPAFAAPAPALGATDLLYSLDQLTQKVVASVLTVQRARAPHGGGARAGVAIAVPRTESDGGAGVGEVEEDEGASFEPRSGSERVSPADLARARRQFLVYARSHAHAFAAMPAHMIRQQFLHYLNETL